ncbi:hypothetical protein NDU88_002441 [Pleurodeles waltl]|uniref:Uncharacterized protein n=1 Tax=Pleurodeles waltl TaxID=8319 RepID=A0AAV7UXN3_PLEWA|nr:hypothetical protein NDU88_002441 [Pleurodeles waltl]
MYTYRSHSCCIHLSNAVALNTDGKLVITVLAGSVYILLRRHVALTFALLIGQTVPPNPAPGAGYARFQTRRREGEACRGRCSSDCGCQRRWCCREQAAVRTPAMPAACHRGPVIRTPREQSGAREKTPREDNPGCPCFAGSPACPAAALLLVHPCQGWVCVGSCVRKSCSGSLRFHEDSG